MSAKRDTGQQLSSGVAQAIKILMLAVVAVTVLLVIRIVLVFFEQLNQVPGYDFVVGVTEGLRAPLSSLPEIPTPYGKGAYFDVASTIIVLALLFVEYILSAMTGYFGRKSRGTGTSTNIQINFQAPPPHPPSTMASDAVKYGASPSAEEETVKAGTGVEEADTPS